MRRRPSLTILLTFTLQSQLFKAACTSVPCQSAGPSCKKWVMEFKGTLPLFPSTGRQCLCVDALVFPAVKSSTGAVWECVSVNQAFFSTFSLWKKQRRVHQVSLSLSPFSRSSIFFYMTWTLEKKEMYCIFICALRMTYTSQINDRC